MNFRVRCPYYRGSILKKLFLQRMYGHFPGPSELSVLERCQYYKGVLN